MTYKFLEEIENIKENLRCSADHLHEEKQRINTRQAEIDAELAALEPRLLRAHRLKSRNDLICPNCFINHDIETPLSAIQGDDDADTHTDYFCCRKCDSNYDYYD